VLLCSATFSDFESEIVEQALCIPRDEWMKFDAAPEFASGQKMQNDIAYDKSATDEETARKIRQFVSTNLHVPMLIFLEKVEDE